MTGSRGFDPRDDQPPPPGYHMRLNRARSEVIGTGSGGGCGRKPRMVPGSPVNDHRFPPSSQHNPHTLTHHRSHTAVSRSPHLRAREHTAAAALPGRHPADFHLGHSAVAADAKHGHLGSGGVRGPQGLGNGSNSRGGRERRSGTGGYDQDYYQVLWRSLGFLLQLAMLVFFGLGRRRAGSFPWRTTLSVANFVVCGTIFLPSHCSL